MTWLTGMEYMCHRWPRICSTCRKHFLLLSSFMAYHLVCSYTNTTGNTSGAGTAHPSGAPEFNPGFSGVRVTRSLALCVWLFVLQYFFFSSLCWLSFELRIMITALVSSKSSYSNLAKRFHWDIYGIPYSFFCRMCNLVLNEQCRYLWCLSKLSEHYL